MTKPTETVPRAGEPRRVRGPPVRPAVAALFMCALFAAHAGAQSQANPPADAEAAAPAAQPAPAAGESPRAAETQSSAAAGPLRRERPDLRGPDVGFPGIGRVLLGFGLCAALALAATFLLRRYWPAVGFIKGNTEVAGIRVVGRARVEASLRLSVVETAGTRVLIAEGRNGVAAVVLAPAAQQTTAGAAPPPAST